MFKLGAIHGICIALFWVALGVLTSTFNLATQPVGFAVGIAAFLPLLFIGYKYKSSVGESPLVTVLSGSKSILYYPAGIAIYTAAVSTYINFQQAPWSLLLFPVSVIGHGLTIGVCIWAGSWFRR